MSSENVYENFRTRLILNLCTVLPADQLPPVLQVIDSTLNDYEISRKKMDLIPACGIPDAVKAYIAAKSIANLSRGSLNQYYYKLTAFFDSVRKSYVDITANDVRMYLYNFKTDRNASDRYLESIRVTINGFFSWLVINGYLQKNPCSTIERIHYQEKKREPLTPYQLESLRWHAEDVREKALIDFFFSTGCRVSECADVRLSDINWADRSVLIRHGKGDKQRFVYFNAEAEISLREYLKTRKDETDALFVSSRSPHAPILAHALENIVRKVAERAQLHVYPHKLRHTFATSGLRGGMPIDKIQALMGHAQPNTTMIYAKQDLLELQREHQRVYA